MHTARATNAILLVGVGFLGFIAAHTTDTPLFILGGVAAFFFAALIAVEAIISAFREGMAEGRGGSSARTAPDPEKRRPADR